MLHFIYDWFVLPPARVVAMCAVIAIWLSPAFAAVYLWFRLVVYFDDVKFEYGNAPILRRVSTFLIVGLICVYAFLVTGDAARQVVSGEMDRIMMRDSE